MKSQDKMVYIAMSGGVDSSVAAALLKKQGYNVVGVFMKPWQPWPGLCMWQGDREDAMRAAAVLGIPFLTWDFSKEYKKEVGDYMIREYRAGRTPNPDVMCNKEIKFGLFLKKALKEGADFIATGHYVRKVERRAACYSLLTARDKNKDQSYFLWTLTQKQLKHCLFPIGDYIKPEVRKLAKKFGLPNHDKKDSQGVCFIGSLNMKDFLKKYIPNKKGKILDKKDNMIGSHDGVYYYTIGQRHGLDIKNGQGPYYVISKDIKKNIIYVGKEKNLGDMTARVGKIKWINSEPRLPAKIGVRTRYRAPINQAILSKNGQLKFKLKERAITPGQSAVFYRGEELLGGGVINSL
ncbi:MAG: tRNA 2-thiouridine(34) synthase MnmA [bacterium]|nr:tRNA 2-thiouridine(34) synthase MnmA [bacterium]